MTIRLKIFILTCIAILALSAYLLPLGPLPYPSAPLRITAQVAQEIRTHQSILGRIQLRLMKKRATAYRARVQNIFDQGQIPDELFGIPAVETFFNNHSGGENGGIWNLSSFTAQFYDLRIDGEIDSRADARLEAQIIVQYLKDLHTSLGTWPLAILAYRKDAGWVKQQIQRNHSDDPWLIEKSADLPGPYLSQVMAMYILMK